MKLFTVDEANHLLPKVAPKLVSIKKLHKNIGSFKSAVSAAAEGAVMGGGGAECGTQYVNALVEIGKLTTEINDLGVQIKDYTRGLIDFPAMRDGRVILLCWQIGEAKTLEWWHEIEGGFAGRKRL
jgi:hypothetical protein